MTRSEPMRTLPLAEFLRLYNDSAYHGWSGYDANDYPPCDADDVQVCFAPDDLPHDRLGRWSSYSLRGKPVSPETAVRLIRILDESVRKEPCFPDVDLLAPSPNSGYDHAHSWIHPDGYMGLDMGCGFWLRGRTIFLLGKGLAITLLRRYDRLYGRHASPDALYQFCGERHEDPNSPFYYGKGGISLE